MKDQEKQRSKDIGESTLNETVKIRVSSSTGTAARYEFGVLGTNKPTIMDEEVRDQRSVLLEKMVSNAGYGEQEL